VSGTPPCGAAVDDASELGALAALGAFGALAAPGALGELGRGWPLGFAPPGNNPTDTACIEAGPLVTAVSNALRSDMTLLTASGDTWGAAFGSPTPGVVATSSGGSGAGGGP
jgi:hypothetical protein